MYTQSTGNKMSLLFWAVWLPMPDLSAQTALFASRNGMAQDCTAPCTLVQQKPYHSSAQLSTPYGDTMCARNTYALNTCLMGL